MFLPVACLKCGKMFQVPESAAGTEVLCPWCKATGPALPVSGLPAAQPVAPVPQEPLSLDDDPPPAPAAKERVSRHDPTPGNRALVFNLAIGVPLTLAILAATIVLLRYGSGYIPPMAWSDFTPPDGSCTIALPGTPDAERIEPSAADGITRGLEQYTSTGWYSRAKVWFGWRDLDPSWVKVALEDRSGAMTTPILSAERDKRKSSTGGVVTKEGSVRFLAFTGLEVQMDTPRGKLIERYILVLDGPRPRLYFMGVEAKNAAADGAAAQRLFTSFRLN